MALHTTDAERGNLSFNPLRPSVSQIVAVMKIYCPDLFHPLNGFTLTRRFHIVQIAFPLGHISLNCTVCVTYAILNGSFISSS